MTHGATSRAGESPVAAPTVLVVEDTEATRYAVTRALTRSGLGVVAAATGSEGLAAARSGEFDLVLLDINLPDMFGFDVCAALKRDPHTRDIPVVFLSASHVSVLDRVRGLDGGADAYLTHPIEPQVLVATVRALLRVREAEARYRRVFETSIIGMLTWDGSGAIVDANDAFLSLAGSDRAALERGELRWTELLSSTWPPHRGDEPAVPSWSSGTARHMELSPRSGTRVPVEVVGAPFGPRRDRGVGFVLDRSAQERSAYDRERALAREKIARQEAEDAQRRLASALRAREDALATVSHDLRTPLQTVDLATHYLDRVLPASAEFEGARRQVAALRRASAQMSSLVRDVLDLARLEAGRLVLDLALTDAAAIVDEAAESHRLVAEAKHLELGSVRPDGVRVSVDRSRLQQAIGNVVGNAIKFTRAGGRVEIGARADGDGALFWVSDTGSGIPPDQLPRVFERFWQVRERGAPAGTGLGLAIAKGIVEAHGGRIWIESRPDEGTTVSFTIPGRAPQQG